MSIYFLYCRQNKIVLNVVSTNIVKLLIESKVIYHIEYCNHRYSINSIYDNLLISDPYITLL